MARTVADLIQAATRAAGNQRQAQEAAQATAAQIAALRGSPPPPATPGGQAGISPGGGAP